MIQQKMANYKKLLFLFLCFILTILETGCTNSYIQGDITIQRKLEAIAGTLKQPSLDVVVKEHKELISTALNKTDILVGKVVDAIPLMYEIYLRHKDD